ncbi:Cof-type HAD-IIB family hydrolase [Prevotella sp. A2931]|uniref:Cof-type HAD-IIB family hydrolase n=1 Tax=Prevotella illustrans TaxID=2800387 RepID=A0ABS3M5W4_9BACT|nr:MULTISPECIES: Cof-type HAD-IIB family hydrolase [Prevotella]MBO1363568.1 Cof-type HAD-IIB family hydrolase [Prevotella illustrans]PTL26196.1 Cof-type HAD-IIB family hydrolase [Prevotella sp. oral taxon 820]
MDRKIKALFFDIDGTLVSFVTHRVPDSAVAALEEAHRNGVKIYISTGRPVRLIVNLQQIDKLIDGYVSTSGAYCFVGKETVRCEPMLREDVDTVLRACRAWSVPVVVVGTSKVADYQDNGAIDRSFRVGLGLRDFHFDSLDEVMREPILQLTPFFSPRQEAEIMPKLKRCTSGRWTDAFVDITSVKADKGIGLRAMADHEGFGIAETMAFGDGGNDIPILRAAGIGVAMGNGRDDVKAMADYVTTHIDDDGIANALHHFSII